MGDGKVHIFCVTPVFVIEDGPILHGLIQKGILFLIKENLSAGLVLKDFKLLTEVNPMGVFGDTQQTLCIYFRVPLIPLIQEC